MSHLRATPTEHSLSAHHPISHLAWLNMALVGVLLFMLFYYVVQNNAMAVQVWRTRDAQERLTALRDERNGLIGSQATLDDRQQLIVLAQQAGMVPAGAVVYLVQERPVAAR